MRDLFLTLSIAGFDPRANLCFGEHHVVVAAGVRDHCLIIDVCDMRANLVEKMAVVRNDDETSLVCAEMILKPVHGIEIEVVRRLVQQQRIRIAEQRLRQQDAHLPAALQFAHLPVVKVFGNIQAVQQDRGIDFGGIAAFIADDAFKFPEPHAVFIRQGARVFGVEDFAFLQGRP